jgi:hypothetical protein
MRERERERERARVFSVIWRDKIGQIERERERDSVECYMSLILFFDHF